MNPPPRPESAAPAPLVYLVDDEPVVRESLRWIIQLAGLEVSAFSDPLAFLAEFDPGRPGCVVLDLRMPEMSGIELQERLSRLQPPPTLLLVSGSADVPAAVEAMRAGALDFLTKPVDQDRLIESIRRAIDQDRENRARHQMRLALRELYETLSPREREILAEVRAGKQSKSIAIDHGISIRTVEQHRARILNKMGTTSWMELIRMIAPLFENADEGVVTTAKIQGRNSARL